jgi:hypothetical protein
MGARIALALVALALVGVHVASAFGYWTVVSGSGGAVSATLGQGATPVAHSVGTTANVVVSWGASSLSNGMAATGYVVARYDATTGVAATVTGGCAGTIAATTCTEPATPAGFWAYTVTPAYGNWRGAESLPSGSVNTGPGAMTLARTLFGGTTPLPATVSGTVSSFAPNETVSYVLDAGTSLVASPTHVDANGNAAISLTIPAGTSDGPHTVHVLGAVAQASVAIVVDTTAPAVTVSTSPVANAAGWIASAPVSVSAAIGDGAGSGIASARYTDDGSDPTSSSTAQDVTGPIAVAATTTLRFVATDVAGNRSAIVAQQVRIDTVPPAFSLDLTSVAGGAYQAPAGSIYYRGASAGSLGIRVSPTADAGSGAASASFPALTSGAGFSFTAGTVSTPTGGPFVSSALAWTAGTSSSPTDAVSLSDLAGNSSSVIETLRNDSTAPSGGSVDATDLTNRYSNSLTLSLALAKGSDTGSGLADGSGPSDLPAKVMRATAALSSSDGIANGSCGTYGAYAQVGAADPGPAVSDTVPTDAACYRYAYLVSDHVGNVATYTSGDIKVENAPAMSLLPTTATLTGLTGTGSLAISGSTLYYNPASAGSFRVDSSASSATSGVEFTTFPTIAGFSGGGVVGAPATGTTFRATYAWSSNAASASPGMQTIMATDNAGMGYSNGNAFTIVKDATGPSGGSVAATGLVGTGSRYSTSLTLSLALARGADSGAGLAASGAQLLRASAPLGSTAGVDGSCGTFGAYAQVGANDPASPKTDVVPADATCYRYAYVVSDKVGNQTTYVSPDVKVDTTAPGTPSLSFSALTAAYWGGSGTVVYYRPSATAGGFTATASAADASSGVASYSFPTLPAGWTGASGGAGIQSYGFAAASPTAPSGAQTVTVTGNTGLHASSSFTVTPDATAPAGGGVTYASGYVSTATTSIVLANGTDTGSGLASGSGLLQRASAPLAGGSCGTFGSFAVVATNPASPDADALATSTCFTYRYLVSDNVGNQVTYSSASIVKADSTGPTHALAIASPVAAYLDATAGVVYYRSSVAGSFRLSDALADAASGPSSVTYPAIATTGWTHALETIATPTGGPFASSTYSWTANPSAPTASSVTGLDLAGNASTAPLAFAADVTGPTGGAIAYTDGVVDATSVPVIASAGSDAGSGIASLAIRRDVAPLTTLTETCGTFAGTYATTVTLVGGADTSVASGSCYRYEIVATDNVGNSTTTTSASVARVDTSGPQVTAIVSQKSNGSAGDGQLAVGDRLIITFNQSLAAASVPTAFSGANEDSNGLFSTVTLSIPGITQGSLSTGSTGYLGLALFGATETFGGTISLANAATATTVTVAITSASGASPSASSGALVFKPATSITDGSGNAAHGSFTTATSFRLF